MEYRLLFFLIPIICLSFPNHIVNNLKKKEIEEKVLFLTYFEDTNIEVLKDYKNEKKKFRYFHVNPCECPGFNRSNKSIDIDGEFKLTELSKIIFCGACETKDISLPYAYSFIQLKSLVNDSTIEFSLNNEVHLLHSSNEYIDTIVSVEKEGKRIIQRTIIIHLVNYGLVNKKDIFDAEGQAKRKEKEERIRDSLEIEFIKQY